MKTRTPVREIAQPVNVLTGYRFTYDKFVFIQATTENYSSLLFKILLNFHI
jgi:hypothetical protein